MALQQDGNWTCNTGNNVEGGLPPGWCKQDPISDVSLWNDKTVFELRNAALAMKLTTVRRTFANGKTDEFKFRVNRATQPVYEVAWLAPQDAGSIELVSAGDNPLEGSMEALEQIQLFMSDEPTPRLRNNSPHWVYIGLRIGHPVDALMQLVIAPGEIEAIAQPGMRPELTWFAAEPQRTDLYAPFP